MDIRNAKPMPSVVDKKLNELQEARIKVANEFEEFLLAVMPAGVPCSDIHFTEPELKQTGEFSWSLAQSYGFKNKQKGF